MATSVLIASPDYEWTVWVTEHLEKDAFKCETVKNGKDCQLKIYKESFKYCLLDVDLERFSAFEVLRYIKLNGPSIHVILVFQSKQHFEELGLDQKGLRKIGISEYLILPASCEKITQAIESFEQRFSWQAVGATPKESKENEEVNVQESDSKFTRIPIKELCMGSVTIFDLFVRLGRNRYVKILHQGDFFSSERLAKYREEKEVEYLYFKTKDRSTYINYMNEIVTKTLASPKIASVKKMGMMQSVAVKIIEGVVADGLRSELFEESMKICKNMERVVGSDQNLKKILREYEDFDPEGKDHAFLVSFFSITIAKNLEWSSSRIADTVGIASILHDIGKIKLPPKLVDLPASQMDLEQFELYKKHPADGAEMLQNFPVVTESVRQIVYQHHEYVNGEGFPNGLTGIKIYPLAKIVTLADAFSHTLVEHKLPPVKCLRIMVSNNKQIQRFDPEAVKALIKAFI